MAEFPLEQYTEPGSENGARLEKHPYDADYLRKLLFHEERTSLEEIRAFLTQPGTAPGEGVVTVDTEDGEQMRSVKAQQPQIIINLRSLTSIPHLNTLLRAANEALPLGGYLACHSRTAGLNRQLIERAHPGPAGRINYCVHFLWHRVLARMSMTRWFYKWVTKGRNRSFTRVEILGRMYKAGFEIVDERFHLGEFFLIGKKIQSPSTQTDRRHNGIIIKLDRVGYRGKTIGVYKFRTMHPYSEYLQPYIYETEGLGRMGKFNHDYRVNALGRRIRGTWIDELPMLLNLLKGDIKLVGVRPLSRQYFSLYSPEMQQLHISVKPGLLPPFYYEDKTPETIEEVQQSERRYIEAYKEDPLATDWHYFRRIMRNILFRHRRSR